MRTYLLPAAVLAAAVLAGCGSAEAPSAAPPSASPTSAAAPTSSAAPVAQGEPGAVPPLSGDPTDLTAPTQAGPGNGEAPATLLTQDVVTGTGTPATPADTVAVRYTGTLWSDGSVFDSSWSGGDAPVEFPLDGVVPGFAQGIEGMAPGGRRVIVMPPELAYGVDPPPGYPAGALVFVVDLVTIT
ncbi:MAG: FKBP-type peptidyl-prolyl cis-trans isomerase [Pseudonocardiales bacterium]|nr:FKBP-type peptidyl-prolyl cis-trans isomerase [Pseudonocardiales bacterium]